MDHQDTLDFESLKLDGTSERPPASSQASDQASPEGSKPQPKWNTGGFHQKVEALQLAQQERPEPPWRQNKQRQPRDDQHSRMTSDKTRQWRKQSSPDGLKSRTEPSDNPKRPALRPRHQVNKKGNQDPLIPTPIPQPTESYIAQSSLPPTPTPPTQLQHLLLVLDLNGTLLFRSKRNTDPSAFELRPHAREFLDYVFSQHSVMIWSSATPRNVKAICEQVFLLEPSFESKCVAVWGRDKFGLEPAQYQQRVQVYKRLERVWEDEGVQARYPVPRRSSKRIKEKKLSEEKGKDGDRAGAKAEAEAEAEAKKDVTVDSIDLSALSLDVDDKERFPKRWEQHNTVLIDDSVLKASAQPFNHIELPEYLGGKEKGREKPALEEVIEVLEEMRKYTDVSAFARDKWNMGKEKEKEKEKEADTQQSEVVKLAGIKVT